MIKRKVNIPWDCETRANLIDEALLKLMKKAGCREIAFGVESGSEAIRQGVLNKGISDEQLVTTMGFLGGLGLKSSPWLAPLLVSVFGGSSTAQRSESSLVSAQSRWAPFRLCSRFGRIRNRKIWRLGAFLNLPAFSPCWRFRTGRFRMLSSRSDFS